MFSFAFNSINYTLMQFKELFENSSLKGKQVIVTLTKPVGIYPKGQRFTMTAFTDGPNKFDAIIEDLTNIVTTNSCKSYKALPFDKRLRQQTLDRILKFNDNSIMFRKTNQPCRLPYDESLSEITKDIRDIQGYFLVCNFERQTQNIHLKADTPNLVRSNYNWTRQDRSSVQTSINQTTDWLETKRNAYLT